MISRFRAIIMLRDRDTTTSCARTLMKSPLHGVFISQCCTATTLRVRTTAISSNGDITMLWFLDIGRSRDESTLTACNHAMSGVRFRGRGRTLYFDGPSLKRLPWPQSATALAVSNASATHPSARTKNASRAILEKICPLHVKPS